MHNLASITFLSDDVLFFLFGICIPILAIWAWLQFKSARASSWPLTQGTIESGSVSVHRGRSRSFIGSYEHATATLTYSYRVNDGYFSGYLDEFFNDEQKAWEFVDGAKARTVQVRYKPNKPDVSMVRSEDQL